MSETTWKRRLIAGASAGTMAASFAIALGAGTAGAAPIASPINWTDGGTSFERTIDNQTPAIGDTITVTTNFNRTGTGTENIERFKDIHPACVTYVANSAKWDGAPVSADTDVTVDEQPDYTLFNIATHGLNTKTHWAVDKGQTKAISLQYKVGADCPIGTDLDSTMHYDSIIVGSHFASVYTDKGPTINVHKVVTSTGDVTAAGTPQVGRSTTLTATVTGGTTGVNVDFKDADGTVLCTAQLADGIATCDWTPAAEGSVAITAHYAGDATTAPSSSTTAVSTTVQAAGSGGNDNGGGDGGADGAGPLGSLGSLGSLSSLFGSLS